MDSSRPPTQLEGPFSPLMFQAPPTIPKIVELDITRQRWARGLVVYSCGELVIILMVEGVQWDLRERDALGKRPLSFVERSSLSQRLTFSPLFYLIEYFSTLNFYTLIK